MLKRVLDENAGWIKGAIARVQAQLKVAIDRGIAFRKAPKEHGGDKKGGSKKEKDHGGRGLQRREDDREFIEV